jgi:hypothetical protein
MQLNTFVEREYSDGDRLQAKEAVDRALVVLVREHRTGVVTQYKPDGGDAVVSDVADVRTNEVWIDVMWMNGAIVDNLAPYVGQPVAVRLVWTPSAKGGNPYIGVKPLDGADLVAAQQWATANSNRFDVERQQRTAAAAAGDGAQQTSASPPQAAVQPAVQPVTVDPTAASDKPPY